MRHEAIPHGQSAHTRSASETLCLPTELIALLLLALLVIVPLSLHHHGGAEDLKGG